MASVCCTQCFSLGNENEHLAGEEIVRLRGMAETLSATSFEDLISYIEDGLNGIVIHNPQHNVSGTVVDSLDILKPCTEFGRDLVQYVLLNGRSCKGCSSEILGYDASKVLRAVLNEAANTRVVVVGLCVVAYVTDEIKKTAAESTVYVQHLLYMLGLLKYIRLQQNQMQRKTLEDVLNFIVLGSLLCGFLRFSTSRKKGHIENMEFRLANAYPDLAMGRVLEELPSLEEELWSEESDAVGIEKAWDEVIDLLGVDSMRRRAVVIHGTHGIGKTTIANSVFDHLLQRLSNYEFYRVKVKPRSSNHDIKILQQQLLHDFSGKNIVLRGCVEGAAHLSNAFRVASRPVLIFIDNVQRNSDLDNLLLSWWDNLSTGSKILITSTEPLQLENTFNYSVSGLDVLEAKNLMFSEVLGNVEARFSLRKNLESLTKWCNGIPLALRMAASYLRQSGDLLSASRHLLEYLQKIPPAEFDSCGSIVDFIYSILEEPYKEAFLDMAIFFNNWERHKVVSTFPEIHLKVLEGIGLIMISSEGKLVVHNVVSERAIALSGQARVTSRQQLEDAFNDESNISKIKGIWLSEGESEIQLEAGHLDLMHKSLRILYLGKSVRVNGECKSTFEEVRFVHIYNKHDFPIDLHNFNRATLLHVSLKKGSDFHNLAQYFHLLELSGAIDLTNFPSPMQLTISLHVIELCDSPSLDKLPEGFNFLSSLEDLDLSNCVNLRDLPDQLGQFKYLCRLKLVACSSIKTLPETLGDLSCLEEMDCADCSSLVGLPASFGQLQSLYYLQLRGCCQLLSLPESFGNLSSLEELDLRSCKKLKSLPDSFIKLKSLFHVQLQGCSELKANISLVGNIGNVSSMEELDLSGCENLSILPDSFSQLKSLRVLKLCCSNLTELPVSTGTMSSLQRLSLTNCERLARLPNSLSQLKSFYRMHLEGCSVITEIPLPPLEELEIRGCSKLVKLPDNIEQHQDSLRVLKLQGCSTLSELPTMLGKLPSLEVVVLNDCESLKALPPSFSQLKSLRHLRLRGASKLTSESVAAFPTSLETLDLSQCSSLESLPEGFANCKNMTLLLLDGCSKLSALPDDFHKLNSLRYLSIAGCTQLQELPHHFDESTSLEAINASGCSALRGEKMIALARMKRLMFADIRENPKLTKQWRSIDRDDLLVMWSETEPEATTYADMLWRFLRYYNGVVWLTMFDPGPDEHTPEIRRKISEICQEMEYADFIRIELRQPDAVAVDMDDEEETPRNPKAALAFACAILGLWKLRDPELFNSRLLTLRTLLVRIHSPEMGKVEMKAILPAFTNEDDDDVERWIDPKGGFTRVVSPFLHFVSESIRQGKEASHQSTH